MRADVGQFAQDGATLLKGLFTDWIAPLRSGVSDLMADPSPFERSYHPDGDATPLVQDLCDWQRVPPLRDFVTGEAAAPNATSASAIERS